MASIFTDSQLDRLSQYRRGKKVAQSSGSDANNDGDNEMFVQQRGVARGVEWNDAFAPGTNSGGILPKNGLGVPVGGSSTPKGSLAAFLGGAGGGGGSGVGASSLAGGHHSTSLSALAAIAATVPTPPVPPMLGGGGVGLLAGNSGSGLAAVAASSSAMDGAAIPADLANYILDLERQNQELRQHVQFLRCTRRTR